VKDEHQREVYARTIVRECAQLTEMVDQLLSYGAERNGTALSQAAQGSLGTAISEAIETSAKELEQSGRAVDVDMPPDLPPVRGDLLTLRRLFINLISNAIRHGGGEIRVSAERKGALVEVRVADSGAGIPPDEIGQIFDPFYRGQLARTGRTRGTGLGLSLVKEMVERLGGSVGVNSRVGKGTEFLVCLPVAE
jgi:signal transduction histidine kinase